MFLSIASNETKPTSLSHGAREILLTSTSTSDFGKKLSSTSRNDGYLSLACELKSYKTLGTLGSYTLGNYCFIFSSYLNL